MKKRILSIILCTVLSFTALSCYVRAESYWDVQADYLKALESGNSDEIISCVEVEWGHAIGQIVSATHESSGLLHVGSGDVQ